MEVECCQPGSVNCSYCVIPEMLRLLCKARLSEMSCLNCGQWTGKKNCTLVYVKPQCISVSFNME